MSFDSAKFQAASEAAESWPAKLAQIAELGRRHDGTGAALAYCMLIPNAEGIGPAYNSFPWPITTHTCLTLQDSHREHAVVLNQMKDRLVGVTTGQFIWPHGLGGRPVAWSSAHEAATGLVYQAIFLLVWPLGQHEDPAERDRRARHLLETESQSLALSWEQVADLKERIYRERVRLLGQVPPQSESDKQPERSQPTSPITAEQAAILKVLLRSEPVPLTIDAIGCKVKLCEKTVAKWLRSLRDQNLVTAAAKKKGSCLTQLGRNQADALPADAGAQLLR